MYLLVSNRMRILFCIFIEILSIAGHKSFYQHPKVNRFVYILEDKKMLSFYSHSFYFCKLTYTWVMVWSFKEARVYVCNSLLFPLFSTGTRGKHSLLLILVWKKDTILFWETSLLFNCVIPYQYIRTVNFCSFILQMREVFLYPSSRLYQAT